MLDLFDVLLGQVVGFLPRRLDGRREHSRRVAGVGIRVLVGAGEEGTAGVCGRKEDWGRMVWGGSGWRGVEDDGVGGWNVVFRGWAGGGRGLDTKDLVCPTGGGGRTSVN